MSASVAKALFAAQPGDLINQDGLSSFSKKRSIAQNFAKGGYAQGSMKQPVVFILHGGTNEGRDIQNVHGFHDETEVLVGSASHLSVTKVTQSGGTIYVHGAEVKQTYVSPHKK